MDPPLESSLHVEPCVYKPALGWLLFLCVILTVVAPGGEILIIFKTLIPLFLRVHRGVVTAFLAIDIAIRGCLAAYSFVAGVKLWSVRRGAVALAKRFLILYLIGNAAIFGFWVLLVGPSKPASYDKWPRNYC